ncbi:type II toxin-antitoxin system YafO family toxin [Oceanimonas smirnovii]|uniref:type II toxin-antitoxin system YafO family toxin n=1 Tax=Oceanimonas smirnovii TaxID=264574 RepID=UPI003FD0CEB4
MSRSNPPRVFRLKSFSEDNTSDPQLEAEKDKLFKDFKAYILAGRHLSEAFHHPFGRDELYDHFHTPSSVKQAALRHVHIVPIRQVRPRRLRKFKATSDVHLVYCIDNLTGYVCALALIKPAHDLARDATFLSNLAKLAEEFYRQAPGL